MVSIRLLIVVGLAAIGIACSGAGRGDTRYLSIATGGTGGVYYPYGGAIARLLSEKVPGVQATAEVTGASVDNLKLLQLGKVDLAFTLADTLGEAQAGTGPFAESGAVSAVRTIAALYTNYTHVVTTTASGIRSVADLRGKTVSVGSPGSGTELIADRILRAAGLDPVRDITRHALGVAESAGALKDGKLDAFIWSGGVPTPAIQDLAATPGMAIALVSHADLLPMLARDHGAGFYRRVVLPGGTYRGLDQDVAVVGVTNMLVASSRLTDELTYDIVRMMFAEKAALVAAHPEARHLEVPAGPEVSPAPFHPGAIRYFKEHGWK